MTERILVTGTGSGLGHALQEYFSAESLARADTPSDHWDDPPYKAIIHCALDLSDDGINSSPSKLINRNLDLLQHIQRIPHQTFVYISSVDVYLKDGIKKVETDPLPPASDDSVYPSIKRLCEASLASTAGRTLILRPSALLGQSAKPNSLIRMLRNPTSSLTLHQDSTFNYVLHRQLGDFVAAALRDELQGIYNIAATGNVSLKEVAALLGATPQFGDFLYEVGQIDNSKAKRAVPDFAMSSSQIITQFVKEFE